MLRDLLKAVTPQPVRRSIRHAREIARDRTWNALGPRVVMPSDLRVEVRSTSDWTIFADVFVYGEYDGSINRVISSGVENPLILDLGGNVGYFALRFSDLWLRARGADAPFTIVGVEGSPKVYSILQKRLDQPQLVGRCRYHLGLAGRRSGSAHIAEIAEHPMNSILSDSAASGPEVPFVDVAKLLPDDRRISLLKCDIEGAEQLFLESYPDVLARVDNVVIEIHNNYVDANRCFALMAEAGLRHVKPLREFGDCRVDMIQRSA